MTLGKLECDSFRHIGMFAAKLINNFIAATHNFIEHITVPQGAGFASAITVHANFGKAKRVT
jgi:hypothetical protein